MKITPRIIAFGILIICVSVSSGVESAPSEDLVRAKEGRTVEKSGIPATTGGDNRVQTVLADASGSSTHVVVVIQIKEAVIEPKEQPIQLKEAVIVPKEQPIQLKEPVIVPKEEPIQLNFLPKESEVLQLASSGYDKYAKGFNYNKNDLQIYLEKHPKYTSKVEKLASDIEDFVDKKAEKRKYPKHLTRALKKQLVDSLSSSNGLARITTSSSNNHHLEEPATKALQDALRETLKKLQRDRTDFYKIIRQLQPTAVELAKITDDLNSGSDEDKKKLDTTASSSQHQNSEPAK